ncbi:hypothetical protein ACIHCQ_42905 [Streptomyces sp. NPDC052236]|uniref:hypothetical protein n=1 Tax=Streptomyces sp. NPDC052236 TaxID=3365686 RepID=UPI0037CDDA80
MPYATAWASERWRIAGTLRPASASPPWAPPHTMESTGRPNRCLTRRRVSRFQGTAQFPGDGPVGYRGTLRT